MDANEMDAEVIDRDRIEVFVSSSMSDEGDFSWQQLRDELNRALLKSDIFKPFAIESHASIEPSSSYYLNRLVQSDIVIGIIRSELRPGTSKELYRAIQLRKPLILVKLEGETSSDIESLFRYVREMDACTYVELPSDSGLVSYLMDQLNNVMVDLFHNRRFEIEDGKPAVFADIAPISIPEDVLDAFGASVALISKKFNYHAEWLERKSDNPHLFFLGEKAVEWLLYGTPFSVGAFKAGILEIMKDSGIPRDTLSLRLDALDASIEGRYSKCYELLQLACDSIQSKDCWAYGNCLIDKRTVAGMLSEYGFGTQWSIQKQIDALSAPAYIPLALKFEEAVGTAVLNASREARAVNPYTTIRHDASLASVMSNISCLLFSSILCGSISSALYSRSLLANSLIDYSSIYNRPDLELEGIKLLVLQGDAKGFENRFAYKSDGLRSYLPSCAEELWRLTSLTAQAYRPSTRAVVIKECAPYFSDDTICDAWSTLNAADDFRQSASKWIKAIGMIKMRVDEKDVYKRQASASAACSRRSTPPSSSTRRGRFPRRPCPTTPTRPCPPRWSRSSRATPASWTRWCGGRLGGKACQRGSYSYRPSSSLRAMREPPGFLCWLALFGCRAATLNSAVWATSRCSTALNATRSTLIPITSFSTGRFGG